MPQQQMPSSGSTILDTLKKKMSQLKEELETSKDEIERNRQILDEEKRRREVVRILIIILVREIIININEKKVITKGI
jgi:hypothetical protein